MELQLEGELTKEDYALAQALYFGYRPIYFAATVWLAMVLAIHLTISGPSHLDGLYAELAIWLTGVVIYSLVYPWSQKRGAYKAFKRNKELQIAFKVKLMDTGCSFSSNERGEWSIPRTDSCKWKGSEKIILVYVTPKLFRMYPRRWFASDADYASFQELLAKAIGPMGKARKL